MTLVSDRANGLERTGRNAGQELRKIAEENFHSVEHNVEAHSVKSTPCGEYTIDKVSEAREESARSPKIERNNFVFVIKPERWKLIKGDSGCVSKERRSHR